MYNIFLNLLPAIAIFVNLIGTILVIIFSILDKPKIMHWIYPIMLITECYLDFYVQKSMSFLDYFLIFAWGFMTLKSIFELRYWIFGKIKARKATKTIVPCPNFIKDGQCFNDSDFVCDFVCGDVPCLIQNGNIIKRDLV